jgi:hypothetical protein
MTAPVGERQVKNNSKAASPLPDYNPIPLSAQPAAGNSVVPMPQVCCQAVGSG